MRKSICLVLSAALAMMIVPVAQAATSIQVTPAAALGGSNFGLETQYDGVSINNAFVHDDSPASETVYRFSFRADLGTFDSAIGDIFYLATARSAAPNNLIRAWIRKRENGLYQLRMICRRDAGSNDNRWHQIGGAGFAADSEWVFEWVQASAPGADDGICRVYKNGSLKGELTTIDNDERSVDNFRMGNTNVINITGTIDTSTTGAYYLDTFESLRTTLAP